MVLPGFSRISYFFRFCQAAILHARTLREPKVDNL